MKKELNSHIDFLEHLREKFKEKFGKTRNGAQKDNFVAENARLMENIKKLEQMVIHDTQSKFGERLIANSLKDFMKEIKDTDAEKMISIKQLNDKYEKGFSKIQKQLHQDQDFLKTIKEQIIKNNDYSKSISEADLLQKEIQRYRYYNGVDIDNSYKPLDFKGLLTYEIQREYDIIPMRTKPEITPSGKFIASYILGVQLVNKQHTSKRITISVTQLLENENKFLMVAIINYLLAESKKIFNISDGLECICQLGYNSIEKMSIDRIVDKFYHDEYNNDYYDKSITQQQQWQKQGIPFRILIQHKGKCYVENKVEEEKFGRSVFYVKNTDDNCLIAALFCGYFKKFLQIILNGTTYKFTDNKPLYDYRECRAQNLFKFTMQLKQLLEIKEQDTNDTIIQKFEQLYDCSVLVIDKNDPAIKYPTSENQIILLAGDNHYNVILNYMSYLRKCNSKYDHYKYCFVCHQYYSENKTCNCEPQIKKMEPKVKIVEPKTQEQLEQLRLERQHKAYQSKLFKPPKEYNTNRNFVVFDIESMYVEYPNDEDNKKYIKHHEPWVICFQFVQFIKDTKTYELDNSIEYTNYYSHTYYDDKIKAKGKFIIGQDCCEKFVNFLLQPEICDKYDLIYAHNGGGYDNILILSKMLKTQDKLNINPLFNNGKLLSLKIKNDFNQIEFRDSFRLLSFPIKDFKDNLGLDLKMEKELQEYEFMSPAVLEKFMTNGGVYEKMGVLFRKGILNQQLYNVDSKTYYQYVLKNLNVDYVQRYIDYCHQDVAILAQGMIKFYETAKQQYKDIQEEVNVFNYLTISSFAKNMFLLRAGPDMFEKNIFDLDYKRSLVEMKFVKMIADNYQIVNQIFKTQFKNLKVISTNVQVDKYNVDITVKDENNKKYIIEVDGIYYHGLILNEVNITNTTTKQFQNSYTGELFEAEVNTYEDSMIQQHSRILETRLKHHNIKSKFLDDFCKFYGYEKVFHITDREIDNYIKENKLIVNVENNMQIQNRDVLRGGRTECYVHYAKIDTSSHCIRGYDTTSLYPGAMLQNVPLRESVVVKGGDQKYVNYLWNYANEIKSKSRIAEEILMKLLIRPDPRVGFVKCKILPPRSLLIPSLCVKLCDKLLAPLCRTCAELQCKDVNYEIKQCQHNDEERALFGYFVDIEIIHAFTLGYRILQVYETIIYEKSSFNDPSYHGNEFIKDCLYYKSVNSDPNDYNEEVFKSLECLGFEGYEKDGNKYLRYTKYKGNEKIITENKIIENKAIKSLQKLIVNSTYGGMGMSVVQESYLMSKDVENCDTNIYMNVNPMFIGNYVYTRSIANEELQQLNNCQSNHFYAGTITAIGRTTLYLLQQHIQEKYEGKILYSDTDSCYCVVPIKYKKIQGFALQGTLGIKNEIKFNDADEFICIGSKAYAYKSAFGKYNQTAKGLSYEPNIKYKLLSKQEKKLLELKEKNDTITQQESFDLFINKMPKISKLNEINQGPVETFELYKQVLNQYLTQSQKQIEVKQENNFVKLHTADKQFEIIQDKNMSKQINYNERKRIIVVDESNDTIESVPFGYVE